MPSHVVTASGEHEESTTAEVHADALDPLVGQTLDGRFRIVDVIGKGAMGRVYRAVQLPLNRAVALKVLDSRYGAGRDESFKQRFLVEAALTSKLSHPNTVRVLDYGSTPDGLFFLAMEYLDGEGLDVVLERGALPWHRSVSIGLQIARALREAHELGVVHRDLKPGNVVLLHADDDTDFVKVLDFGLVKSFIEGHELEGRAITQQGMLMGSPPYMAPEQGDRNRADPRSDIYSLGVMLFEMLTGKPPFTGGAPLEIIMKHVHEPVPPLVAPGHFERVPSELGALVTRCLAKSPMDRYQSMDELILALQDVAPPPARTVTQDGPPTESAVPVVAPPESPAAAGAATTTGSRPRLVLMAGFLGAVVAGVVVTAWAMRRATPGTVTFHLETTPPGATVVSQGQVLGVTPLDLERPAGEGGWSRAELSLQLPGYLPTSLQVAGSGGRVALSQTLQPVPPTPTPAAAPLPVAAPAAQPELTPLPRLAAPPRPPPPVAPGSAAPTATSRPASRLEEDEAPTPAANELKRPAPQ